jgi:hypothetical protein
LSGCKRQAGMPVRLQKTGRNACPAAKDRQECLSGCKRQAGMPVLLIAIGQIILLQCLRVVKQPLGENQ